LRPFVDEMIAKGVLPMPQDGGEYDVEWMENLALSEEAMATIAEKKTNAITKYAGTMGSEDIVPPDVFLSEVMGFSEETVERIQETRQELWDKELEDSLKDEETLAEEERKKKEILEELPSQQPAKPQQVVVEPK
jgi:asparagine synthetase B (glutamine-hydrolysing)